MGGLDKKKSGSLKTPESLQPAVAAAGENKVKAEEDGGTKPEVASVKTEEEEKPAASDLQDDTKPSESQPAAAAASSVTSNQTDSTAPSNDVDGAKVTVSSSHNATQVQNWVQLLENKPDPGDKQAMAVWMLNLMSATDASGNGVATASVALAAAAAPPAAASADAPVKEEEPPPTADTGAAVSQEVTAEEPLDATPAAVSEDAKPASPVAEEGSAAASATASSEDKRENSEEENTHADSNTSHVSQPPKKKFKQEFEEI